MSEDNKLLDISAVAQILKVSEVTVKRYARENLLQGTEQNGQLMFESQNVENYRKISERLGR